MNILELATYIYKSLNGVATTNIYEGVAPNQIADTVNELVVVRAMSVRYKSDFSEGLAKGIVIVDMYARNKAKGVKNTALLSQMTTKVENVIKNMPKSPYIVISSYDARNANPISDFNSQSITLLITF